MYPNTMFILLAFVSVISLLAIAIMTSGRRQPLVVYIPPVEAADNDSVGCAATLVILLAVAAVFVLLWR